MMQCAEKDRDFLNLIEYDLRRYAKNAVSTALFSNIRIVPTQP